MTGSSSIVAQVFTAVAACLTALGLLVTAWGVLLPILRGTRANTKAIGEVHVIVNQQRTDMLALITDQRRYNRALISALTSAGIDVPADQSIEPDDSAPV